MIDYKTYDEQVEILKNRGMYIEDDETVKNLLKQNNYYNLLNGYKDIFIQKGTTPERFIKGARFSELYALQQFDKELRADLSRYLILIERSFASILSHEFSRTHANHDLDYLNVLSYNTKTYYNKTTKTSIIRASELVTELSKEFNRSIDHSDSMMCHYKNKYGRVPLWVFVNKLSFGTLSKMYQSLQDSDRDNIAISISKFSNIQLFANDVQNGITVLVLLRNKCAHDQRIYDFDSYPTLIKPNNFLKKYLPNTQHISSLFGAISCLSLFFPSNIFNNFLKKIKKSILTLFSRINSIPTQTILNKMGVPQSFLL